ncbi:hypothetical protein BC332_25089 [Capsicum chinense]|nr:hypothetical protein BC332_25089 [Capsicum chinense]
MDDVWDTKAWDVVKRSFPDDKNGSRVILTSRLANVFGRDNFPFELEKATKQIVEKCQGLPLTIVVVAGFCSKVRKTENYWEDVAHKIGLVMSRGTKECLDLLTLSYNYLPDHLKSCFLYMGAFPKEFEISVSRLIKLWIAAEYVRCTPEKDFEKVAEGYLRDLIDRSLIMAKKNTSSGKFKTFEVHDLLHDLILRDAWKERSIYSTKSNVIVSPDASFEHRIIFNFPGGFYRPSLPHTSSFLCFGRDRTPGSCTQTLSYITFGSITRHVFEGMPNLKKLGILESEEECSTADQMSGKLKKLVLLAHLETFKGFFIKPWILEQCDVFPRTLKKLTLRGCQLPWEQIMILCELPKLEVLKLKDYAFQGSEWEPTDERFQQLKFLLLDGTDLIHWKASFIQFPKLKSLVLKNCYCLYEIPDDVAEIPTLQFIELYHCSSSADDSAYRIQEEQLSIGNDDLVVQIHK